MFDVKASGEHLHASLEGVAATNMQLTGSYRSEKWVHVLFRWVVYMILFASHEAFFVDDGRGLIGHSLPQVVHMQLQVCFAAQDANMCVQIWNW